MSMVTSTLLKSSPRLIARTWPISTSLYLTLVLPGSSPSALLKLTVTVGPWSIMDLVTSAAPISAASKGISHTSDGSQRLALSTSGSATTLVLSFSFSDMLLSNRQFIFFRIAACLVVDRVPDQTRIELHRCYYGYGDHRAERQRTGAGRDHGQRFEAHQGHRQGDHEDIEHGPAADEFDHA